MSSLSKWLLRLAQYYGIIFGFTYIYIDYKNRHIKIYRSVQIYAYFINFLYVAATIHYYTFVLTRFPLFYHEHPVVSYAAMIQHILRLVIFIGLIVIRLKEEKLLKKLFEIYLPLQVLYFDNVTHISADETIKYSVILNIFNVMAHSMCFVLNAFVYKVNGKPWFDVMSTCFLNYFLAMQHFIMLHHVLVLSYINHCFKKLNVQLHRQQVTEYFARIYYKISLLLEQVNHLNGPLIFFVLVSLLLANSIYAYGLILYDFNIRLLSYDLLFDFCTFIIFCMDIFLYFLICDRVKNTTNESAYILMEYSVNKNQQETEIVALGRLTMELDVNICGFFSIDLEALNTLITEIVTLTIILIQIEYFSGTYNGEILETDV
ncbi:uncharacterized protein ACRADG_009448 [Cochliomyia hominivorax]